MKKLSALALGTALGLSMPLAALAQDAGVGVTLDGGVATELGGEDAGVDVGVDAGVDADAEAGVDVGVDADAEVSGDVDAASGHTFADLDAALQGAGTADLSGVTAETEIEIVEVDSLGEDGEFTAAAYGEARADFESDIGLLQTNIEGNADFVAAIEAAGYTTQDVVAVWSEADGSLTVFVESQESHEAEAAEQSGLAVEGDAEAEGGAAAGDDAAANGEVTVQ